MKILIVEDDLRVAELIQRGLQENDFETEVAYDGHSGKTAALADDFDLIITDIILPEKNGIELCKELKSALPDTPVLMLTALGTTDEKVEGFDAGADDYLVKPFEMRELLARIKALLNRYQRRIQTSHLLKYADIEMNLNTKTVKRNNKEIRLTPKEFNFLKYMLRNPERVLSRTEIAEKVWDTHFDTGTNFIDVYVSYIRNKIEKGFDSKLIHTQSGMGFILMKE